MNRDGHSTGDGGFKVRRAWCGVGTRWSTGLAWADHALSPSCQKSTPVVFNLFPFIQTEVLPVQKIRIAHRHYTLVLVLQCYSCLLHLRTRTTIQDVYQ